MYTMAFFSDEYIVNSDLREKKRNVTVNIIPVIAYNLLRMGGEKSTYFSYHVSKEIVPGCQ